MASRHKFYNELGTLRKRLEFGERIVYNKGDESQPLCEPDWQKLYSQIDDLCPRGDVYHHNCDFGIHLVNLSILGHTCYGSVVSMHWAEEGNKWIDLKDHAAIREIDRTDSIKDVTLTDIILCSAEDATEHLDLFKSKSRYVVIYARDKSISVVDGEFVGIDSLSFDVPEGDLDEDIDNLDGPHDHKYGLTAEDRLANTIQDVKTTNPKTVREADEFMRQLEKDKDEESGTSS